MVDTQERMAMISLFLIVIGIVKEEYLIQNSEIFPNMETSSHEKYPVMLTSKQTQNCDSLNDTHQLETTEVKPTSSTALPAFSTPSTQYKGRK